MGINIHVCVCVYSGITRRQSNSSYSSIARAKLSPYRHIRVAYLTQELLCILTVVKGPPAYFGFNDRTFCKLLVGVESTIIWCVIALQWHTVSCPPPCSCSHFFVQPS